MTTNPKITDAAVEAGIAMLEEIWHASDKAPCDDATIVAKIIESALPHMQQAGVELTVEAAEAMGAKGGPHNEAERLAFEAWMRGHCWSLSAAWDGKHYTNEVEKAGGWCPHATRTRGLWAAWRDRAALTPPAQPEAGVPEELSRIGGLIATQDNRITDQPIFVVQQKRRICGVADGYADGFEWHYPGAEISYDDAGKAERDAERSEDGLQQLEWEQIGYVDTWEFVTACFTEQGCKDYLARNGHNLREPRIYADGSYRNQEWREVRNFLLSLAAAGRGG